MISKVRCDDDDDDSGGDDVVLLLPMLLFLSQRLIHYSLSLSPGDGRAGEMGMINKIN